MYEETERALENSLDLAKKFRKENGMFNPEDVTVRPYFERDRRITKVKTEEGWIAYNVQGILMDAVRQDDPMISKKAHEALQGGRDKDRVAAEVVNRWNDLFEEQHEKAISVSCIFHSLEEIMFRRSVPRQSDSIFEDFMEEVIPGKIRDEIFRNLDSVTAKTQNASKLPTLLADYIEKSKDLPSPESYRNCHDLLDVIEDMDPLEIYRSYDKWDAPKEVVEDQ